MPSKILIEVCAESLFDAKAAEQAGADRIELNSSLRVGGLTPSLGVLQLIKEQTSIPVISMIRPRESGFCYSDDEFQTMLRDAELQLEHGAEGIAFGILNTDGSLDLPRCRQLVDLTKGKSREAVIHRAFDYIPDFKEAIDQCVEMGFDRLMTSGKAATAPFGSDLIAKIIEYAEDRIEVLPASGISSENILALIEKTGCTQLHGSFSTAKNDPSAKLGESLIDSNRDANSFRTACFELINNCIN